MAREYFDLRRVIIRYIEECSDDDKFGTEFVSEVISVTLGNDWKDRVQGEEEFRKRTWRPAQGVSVHPEDPEAYQRKIVESSKPVPRDKEGFLLVRHG